MRDRPDKRSSATVPLLALAASLLFGTWHLAFGTVPDEFKAKRQDTFEFTEKPTITRDGDKVTITFASKAFCDATVAIEDADGNIVRHLASGVLGLNAPEPFKKDSLTQAIVWDSKDDRGDYVKGRDRLNVRVSLGLKPQFERTFYWSPYKRQTQAHLPIIRSCPEGVLIYEGQIYDSVRLFDHKGDYMRTVYPFPADKLASFEDLQWATAPQDGARLPKKQWFRQATLLTSGDNSNHPFRGYGEERFAHDGHGASAGHRAASAMAVSDKRIALAMQRLNRMTTDGASGGLPLEGPELSFDTVKGGYYTEQARMVIRPEPTSAALSPDGKWLYLTGYMWVSDWGTGGRRNMWLPGVVRMSYDQTGDAGKPTVFAGSVNKDDEGKDNGHFTVPTSVACDSKGRVYVADYMNDRIQVFLPDGTFFKTVPARKPAQIVVHPKTGNIYVFSWLVGTWHMLPKEKPTPGGVRGDEVKEHVAAELTCLGPVDKPDKLATYSLPLLNYGDYCGAWTSGLQYHAEVDCWADELTVWLYPGNDVVNSFTGYQGQLRGFSYWQPTGVQLLQVRDGKLAVVRDFGVESAKAVLKTSRVAGINRNMCVNPRTGKLYVGDGSSGEGFSWSLSVEIDPATGKSRLVELPFDCEQMVFDIDGLAYLRARGTLVRYEPTGWREVPWDYGEEHDRIATASSQNFGPGFKQSDKVASAVVVPYWEHAPNGTFSISPKGNIVIPIKGRQSSGVVLRKTEENKLTQEKPYEFRLYPGRSVSGLVLVLDHKGKLVYNDAVPGLTYTHGIKIDKDDNLYALALANRVGPDGKPYWNAAAGTLIKFKPRAARIMGVHPYAVPVPMTADQRPKRPPDMLGGGKTGLGQTWVEGAEWFYGGVGYNGEHHGNPDYGCDCCHSSFDLDLFARAFVPEVDHYSVAVLDTNGNLVLRIGKYGNVDDGKPMIVDGGPGESGRPEGSRPRPVGGDEVVLFHAPHLATHTDHRLFIADVGNERIVSVKLDYHATEKVSLK